MNPLSGRLIIDASALLPGAFAAMLLQNLGARVVRIARKSPAPHAELEAFYEAANRGKALEPLDLSDGHPDRARFEALVREADGLIEGYRPSVRRKLGLDVAHLHALNPRLQIVGVAGFAETDPRAERPVHDLNLQALSGALGLFGTLPGLPLAQLFTAYEAALAMAAALGAPTGSRQGVSAMDALARAQTCARAAAARAGEGFAPGHTLLTGRYPCYRVYSTWDKREISVAALEPRYWREFCAVISAPELADQAFSEDEVVADRVQRLLGAKPWPYWQPLFEETPCCVEPLLSYPEVR